MTKTSGFDEDWMERSGTSRPQTTQTACGSCEPESGSDLAGWAWMRAARIRWELKLAAAVYGG
jgi:hypothetical protein